MKPWKNTSQKARALLAGRIDRGDAYCTQCGRPVLPGQLWDVAHLVPRDVAPDLTHDPDNWGIDHRGCNRSAGAAYGNRKRGQGRPPRPRILLPAPSREW